MVLFPALCAYTVARSGGSFCRRAQNRPKPADEAALARKLRVKNIVTIPEMEGRKGAKGGDLVCLIVNLADYTVGADKGGAVSMFDDFDIDFNAQKYLIETRCSGALTTPFSAMAVEWAA